MARYIDADELLNRLPNDLPYKASVKRVLIQAPTADVVPKTEVANIFAEFDAMIELVSAMTGFNVIAYGGKFAELKKKYTEENNNENKD